VKDKRVSVIEVGPFHEQLLAKELNRFFGTEIEELNRTNSYLLVHQPDLKGLESLLTGTPFVDPIIHRATLNESLALQLHIPFDYVLQSMLNPGTSDAEGTVALEQALLALNSGVYEDDRGFLSQNYFLKADNITQKQLREVSEFLANPDLKELVTITRHEYEKGFKIEAPIVVLPPKIKVEKYDIANMSDEELLELNSKRKLAASLEELHQFRDMYKDEEFLARRREVGLDERATDVEIETWFSLRSEHCFHKEFNARITLDDMVDDPIFQRAHEKGWLTKNEDGAYVLEEGLFKTFIEDPAWGVYNKLEKRGKNWIVDMFKDNSGVVLYNEDYMLCIKFETHNSPSNKEPIQGAKTGIDGVNRDIFGTMRGTFEALANFFFYCTGDPRYKGWLPEGVKHPYTLLKGVTEGVKQGGNEMQIPTFGGGMIADPRYMFKTLVYCGTIGWSPVKSPEGISYIGKNPGVGDLVFVAGQTVGVDGIHGATESSLSAGRHISLGHVQADFSFIQAKMQGYLLEVARDNLLTSVTDFGAVGLGSASHETAEATGGLWMDLSLHPRKYLGIQPWQINISETQDRMLLVAKLENKEELLERAKLHDVDVTELGKLTDSGFVDLKYGDETVALIDIEKLFNKEPRKQMHATWSGTERKEVTIKEKYTLEQTLRLVMSRPGVASKEWFFRQKDYSVKGGTILAPLQGAKQQIEADATIQKPLDTEGKDFGAVAYAMGIAPKVSDLDPYHAAQKSLIDMAGKIIAVGGALPDMKNAKWDAWAVCGNYCQPNSDSTTTLTKEDGEHNLASLLREGMGVREAIEATNIPVISGKDSMKCSGFYEVPKDFKLEHIHPDLRRHITLVENEKGKFIEIHDPDSYLASAAVKIDDYRKCVTSAFKQEGDLIYVVGTTKNHLGASQYLEAIGYEEQEAPIEGGEVPEADLEKFVRIARKLHRTIDREFVASCSYIHDGGLLTAVSKAAMAGDKGVGINVKDIFFEGDANTDEDVLYSETPGRFIVTIDPENKRRFERIMGSNAHMIGQVEKSNLFVTGSDGKHNFIHLDTVMENYQETLSFGLNDLAE